MQVLVLVASARSSGFTPDARCVFAIGTDGSSKVAIGGSSVSGGGDYGTAGSGDGGDGVWSADAGARWVSSAILFCETPALRLGALRVTASTTQHVTHAKNNGDGPVFGFGQAVGWSAWRGAPETLAAAANVETATTAPRREAVDTFVAPEHGGASVTLFLGTGSSGSADSEGVVCRFGTVTVRARVVDPGRADDKDTAGGVASPRRATVTCATPGGAPSSFRIPVWVTVGISVRAPLVMPTMTRASALVSLARVFESMDVADPGAVRAVTPRRVATWGTPSAVVVVGIGFSQDTSRCVIDGVGSVSATVVSSAIMMCELPPSGRPGVATAAASLAPRALQAARADGATVTYAVQAVAVGMDISLGATSGGAVTTFTASASLPDGDAVSTVVARFGTVGPVATRFVSRVTAETVTPARRAGYANARLDGGAGASAASSTSSLVFQYVHAGAVVDAIPSLVPVTGNVPVELVGWGQSVGFGGFKTFFVCSFGGVPSEHKCLSPPGNVGFVAVAVTGASSAGAGSAVIQYAPRPRVAGVAPRTNYARGGAVTTLFGTDFVELGSPGCAFSGTDSRFAIFVHADFVSTALVRCETPYLAPGSMATVEFGGGGSSSITSASAITVTILATPRVLSSFPKGGPLRGGTVISVTGENFVGVEPAACRIGSVGPLDARDGDVTGLAQASTLECVAPARGVGKSRVAVGARTGAGYTGDDVWYEYVSALPVDAVVPTSGETTGGGANGRRLVLSVFGATLRTGEPVKCVVGNAAAPGDIKRHGEITCGAAPASGFGVTDTPRGGFFSATNEGFFAVGVGGLQPLNGELAVVFLFRKPAAVTTISPTVGFVGGGSVVRVNGAHMSENTGCSFASTVVFPDVQFVSSALLRCEAPAFVEDVLPGGVVPFAASDASSPPGEATLLFAPIAEPNVADATPSAVTETGGDAVDVHFADSSSRFHQACSFGTVGPVSGRAADSHYQHGNALRCVAPALKPGAYKIHVASGGGEYGRVGFVVRVNAVRVGYTSLTSEDHDAVVVPTVATRNRNPQKKPSVHSAFPNVASSRGGAVVFVAGTNFDYATGDGVSFGDDLKTQIAVRFANLVSSSLAILETPGGALVGSGDTYRLFAVTGGSGSTTHDVHDVAFAFAQPPTLTSLKQNHVSALFGGVVTVTGAFGDAGGGSSSCRFGSVGPVHARVVDAATVECFAPARAESTVAVALSTRGDNTYSFRENSEATQKISLEYVSEKEAASRDAREARGPEWLRVELAVVSSVVPSSAPKAGGGRATISGVNLYNFVAFGDAVVRVSNFVSSVLVVVETPSAGFAVQTRNGKKTVASPNDVSRVAVRGFDLGFDDGVPDDITGGVSNQKNDLRFDSDNLVAFAYVDVSDSVSFAPAHAPASGGAALTVTVRVAGAGTASAACRVGTVGPLIGSLGAADGVAQVCITPASKPGGKRVSAGATGTRDASSYFTASAALLVTPSPEIQHVVPSAVTRGTKQVNVAGAWLDGVICADAAVTTDSSSEKENAVPVFAAWTTCTASALGAGGLGGAFTSFVAVQLAFGGSRFFANDVFLTRLTAPRVRGVASSSGGTEGGAVLFVTGTGFDPALLCAFSGTAESARGDAAFAVAFAVSAAVARCETVSLHDVLGVGGGEVSVSAFANEDASDTTTALPVAWNAAPTPWALSNSPTRGGGSGGTSVTVAVAGAVESVKRREVSAASKTGFKTQTVGTSVSCAFGTVAPVSARPAGDDSPRDVLCVSPASRHGSIVPLRVFLGTAHLAPRAPSKRGLSSLTFRTFGEGGTVSARVTRSRSPLGGGDPFATVYGWGLRAIDVCAFGEAQATVVAEGDMVEQRLDGERRQKVSKQGTGVVNCVVPTGAPGFFVVSAQASSHNHHLAGVALQISRHEAPFLATGLPAVVLAGLGDVVRFAGANAHAAGFVEWRGFLGGKTSFVTAISVHVSSAVVLTETPAFHAESVVGVEACLVPLGAIASSDTRGASDTQVSSVAMTVTPRLTVLATTPTRGSANGGVAVSLATSPSFGNRENAAAAACWFGTIGPVVASRAGDKAGGDVHCVSPAGTPGYTSTRVATAPGLAFGRPGAEGAVFRKVSSSPVSPALMRAAVTTSLGGDVEFWVSTAERSVGTAVTDHTRVVFGTTSLDTTRSNSGGGFIRSIRVPPGARGGFVALALANPTKQAHVPFAHVLAVATPDPLSIAPSETVSGGGGLVWVVGVNLRSGDGVDLAGIAASIAQGGAGANEHKVPTRSAVHAASALHSASSALAAFEAPAAAPGTGHSFRFVFGDTTILSRPLPFATRALGATRGPTTKPATWFASPVGGGGAAVAVVVPGDDSLAAFSWDSSDSAETVTRRADPGAACRFGSVVVAASSATAAATACVAPALAPGVGVVETSFNGRDWTNGEHTRFRVVAPPTALTGVMPSAVPAGAANGALFGVEVVGAGLDRLERVDRLPWLDRLDLFGLTPMDDLDYEAAASANVSVTRVTSGGVVAARVIAASDETSVRPGVPDGFGFGFGFVAVAVDAFIATDGRGASLEHLVVSVFAPPRVLSIDPPIGPCVGGALVVLRGGELRNEGEKPFQTKFTAVDGSGGSVVTDIAYVVSSAIVFVETPEKVGTDLVTVRVVAGNDLVSASTAAVPTFAPTSAAATFPFVDKDSSGAIGAHGGSVVSVAFRGLAAGGSGALPFWCRFGSIGPVAARPSSDGDGTATSSTVACTAPASAPGSRWVLFVSNNKRDWFAAKDFDTNEPVVFVAVAAARPEFAFPPATSAVGGGVGDFGNSGSISVTFAAPAPVARVVPPNAAKLGCAFGGTFGFAKTNGAGVPGLISPHAADTFLGRIDCFPASDPFVEGFFPLQFTLDRGGGPNAFSTDADASSNAQIQFEYVSVPRVYALVPDIAHIGGGALVFITGADLRRDGEDAVRCAFASGASENAAFAAAVAVTTVSSALVVCETPSAIASGVGSVRVGLAGSGAFGAAGTSGGISSGGSLVTTPPPTIADVSPTSVSTTGGAIVTLTGSRLRAVSPDDLLHACFATIAPIFLRPGSGSSVSFITPARQTTSNDELFSLRALRSLADIGAEAPFLTGGGNRVGFQVTSPFVPLRDGVVPSVVSSLGGASSLQARLVVDRAPGVFFNLGDKVSLPVVFGTGGGARQNGFQVVSLDVSSNVGLTNAWTVTKAHGVQFETVSPARIFSVAPKSVASSTRSSTGGGSLLDVSGMDFARGDLASGAVGSSATRVRFGAVVSGVGDSAVHVVSSALLRVEVFGDHAADSRVSIEAASAPGFDSVSPTDPSWSADGVSVDARTLPNVFRARPNFGTERGGVSCVLTGTGFRDTGSSLKCAFGSVTVTAAAYVDVNRVECVSPARAPDAATLSATAPVGVSINGRDFSASAFGSGAPGVTLYDTHHDTGRGNAHVHGGREASFVYGAALEVFGLDPVRGPSTGGTGVVVRGAHFLGLFATERFAASGIGGAFVSTKDMDRNFFFGCRFDQQVVPASVGGVTASAALCRSPPHAAGFVAVEVRAGNSGNFTVFGTTFEFQAPVAVELLFPPVGAAGGGTLVSVTGANFVRSSGEIGGEGVDRGRGTAMGSQSSGGLRCRFGGGSESAAFAVSSAVLRCETPSFSETQVDRALAVDVSLNGGFDFSTSRTYFEPLAEPFVLGLEPRAGTAGGGTVVNVYGRGFTADAPVWCKFGTTGPIPAEYTSNGAVRCKSPAKATASRIPVEVSRGNVLDLTRDAVLFSV